MSIHPPLPSLNGPNYIEGLSMPDDSTRALLPEDIQHKLGLIEEVHDRLDSAVTAATAAENDMREARIIAKSNRERLESQSVVAGSNISKAQLDVARDKEARARRLEDEAAARRNVPVRERDGVRQVGGSTTRLIEGSRTYVSAGDKAGPLNTIAGRGEFSGFDLRFAPPVKLSGDPKDIVAKQRGIIDGLLRERKAVEDAPFPRESVEARLISDIDKAAARAKLGVDLGARGRRDSAAIARFGVDFDERSARDPSVIWPTRGIDGILRNEGGRVMHVDAEAFLARFHRDELVAEIREALDKAYASVEMTLDPGEANARLRDIKKTLVEAERIECAAIWRLLEDGATDVFFRPDTNPRAILGVM